MPANTLIPIDWLNAGSSALIVVVFIYLIFLVGRNIVPELKNLTEALNGLKGAVSNTNSNSDKMVSYLIENQKQNAVIVERLDNLIKAVDKNGGK